jgi:dTDP-4-dehydrorhamnose 3,5-epimerase
MPFIETGIRDLYIFEPVVFQDSRGYFFESYNENTVTNQGLGGSFVQDNQSFSSYGVIRGLHFQREPHAQTKLVRVLSGAILDVAVDIRKGSPTYGKVFSVELSAENKRQLYIPKGFAHGFSVLSQSAEILYKCDRFFNKASEGGVIYNDPALAIDWKIPAGKELVSDKDKVLLPLAEIQNDFVY